MKNFTLIITSLIAVICFFTSADVHAQMESHQVGIRASSLSDFGYIHKKKTGENKYKRFRAGIVNLRLNGGRNSTNLSGSFFFAFGVEKHHPIAEDFSYFHGFEPRLGFGFKNTWIDAVDENVTTYNLNIGAGYVMGFEYNLNEKFNLALEFIPNLILNYEFGDVEVNRYDVRASIGITNLALTATYKFEFDKEEMK